MEISCITQPDVNRLSLLAALDSSSRGFTGEFVCYMRALLTESLVGLNLFFFLVFCGVFLVLLVLV